MKVLVCGATGCVGRAAAHALRARGHQVVEGTRGGVDGRWTMHVDYMQPRTPRAWADTLTAARIEAVVNCVGILMPAPGQSFERVHAEGPIELFRGAALAGVPRIVQVSALGVGHDAACLERPYLHSKLRADEALAALPVDAVVLRPSLLYGPGSQSAALFATLASLPVIGLPGRGAQEVQPIHVYEIGEIIARLVERSGPVRGVHEVGGPEVLAYRDMLQRYRHALGLGNALSLPVPMVAMRLFAWLAEALPQRVFCRDTIALLERGSVARPNAAPMLLGRAPTSMAHGLAVTPPQPLLDLRVSLAPPVELALRVSLAFMWLYTAVVSALWPQASGVLQLLARCGFEGQAGVAVLVASCGLNTALGISTLRRPAPWTYALQCLAVVGYTATAAWNMPALTLDHCGPLVKNVPLLGLILVLWLATPAPARGSGRLASAKVGPHGSTEPAPARGRAARVHQPARRRLFDADRPVLPARVPGGRHAGGRGRPGRLPLRQPAAVGLGGQCGAGDHPARGRAQHAHEHVPRRAAAGAAAGDPGRRDHGGDRRGGGDAGDGTRLAAGPAARRDRRLHRRGRRLLRAAPFGAAAA
jgi:uncharacterized protein YbjT (DUF2867 family)